MKRIFPAVKIRPQTPPIDKREIGDAAIPGERRIHTSPSSPPQTNAISQWTRSLEWRHAVTLHILVGKICITWFPFSCEACSLYLVLWLCVAKCSEHLYFRLFSLTDFWITTINTEHTYMTCILRELVCIMCHKSSINTMTRYNEWHSSSGYLFKPSLFAQYHSFLHWQPKSYNKSYLLRYLSSVFSCTD